MKRLMSAVGACRCYAVVSGEGASLSLRASASKRRVPLVNRRVVDVAAARARAQSTISYLHFNRPAPGTLGRGLRVVPEAVLRAQLLRDAREGTLDGGRAVGVVVVAPGSQRHLAQVAAGLLVIP